MLRSSQKKKYYSLAQPHRFEGNHLTKLYFEACCRACQSLNPGAVSVQTLKTDLKLMEHHCKCLVCVNSSSSHPSPMRCRYYYYFLFTAKEAEEQGCLTCQK